MTTSMPNPVLPPPLTRTLESAHESWTSSSELTFEHLLARDQAADQPPIDRPRQYGSVRLVLAALGVAVVVLCVQISVGATGADAADAPSLRAAALLLLAAYALGHVVFALWTLRQRVVIDRLKWRSFRRDVWAGSWATWWSALLPIAGIAFVLLSLADNDATAAAVVLPVLALIRVVMLKALGLNMSRVVFRARRWLGTWGVATAVADTFVLAIVVDAFIEPEPRRDPLEFVSAWAPVAIVGAALLQLAYMKRVDRWVVEWWDNRFGVTDDDVLDVLSVVRPLGGIAEPFSGRRLAPIFPLHALVVLTYWGVASAALLVAWRVLTMSGELTFATDPDLAFEGFASAHAVYIGSLIVLQIVQGVWAVTQAWNARRCTVAAPSPLGLAALFLLGPAVLVYGIVVHPDWVPAFVSLAVLLNLGAWVCSFGSMSTAIQLLGRSAQPIVVWSMVVSLHWLLGFCARPLILIDDDQALAVSVGVVAIVDAIIFVAAGLYAWRGMRALELATRDFEQVRRVKV